MVSYKDIADRKYKLIERYRSALQEEMLEEEREQALLEREKDCFAWKGAFRPREEIMRLYVERKRWDRRFLIDTSVLALLLFAVVVATPRLVATVAPRPSWVDTPRHPTSSTPETAAPATEEAKAVPAPAEQ